MTSTNPLTDAESLAQELAKTLEDQKSLLYYRRLVTKHSKEFLLDVLRRVMAVPEDRIRTSRPALFTWLIKHEGDTNTR